MTNLPSPPVEPTDTFVLTVDAVNTLLRGLAMQVLDLPEDYVLIETRTQPRPFDSMPYVTLYWKHNELLKQTEGVFLQPVGLEDGVEEQNNPALCTVQIAVRGKNAYNLCCDIRYALDSSNRYFDLWGTLGFSDCSSVVDLSAVYGGKVQQRAFIDLSFYAAYGRRYPLAWFTSVPWVINGLTTIYPRSA